MVNSKIYKYIYAAAVEGDSEIYVRLAIMFAFLRSLIRCIQKSYYSKTCVISCVLNIFDATVECLRIFSSIK